MADLHTLPLMSATGKLPATIILFSCLMSSFTSFPRIVRAPPMTAGPRMTNDSSSTLRDDKGFLAEPDKDYGRGQPTTDRAAQQNEIQ